LYQSNILSIKATPNNKLQEMSLTAGEECAIAAKTFNFFSENAIPPILLATALGVAIIKGTGLIIFLITVKMEQLLYDYQVAIGVHLALLLYTTKLQTLIHCKKQ
jgi:hypothetical protein